MSLNINGEKCVVCKAYLFEDDDTVYCPECGAPHHRECYNSIEHCGMQEFHGTDKQYKRPEKQVNEEKTNTDKNTVTCSVCGEKYNACESLCPNCNAPDLSKMGGRVVTIDFMGGVPENTDIGDGVTAKEAKNFVATNTHRYIPKFVSFNKGKKFSWNWFAFLIPSSWLVSRKMYLLGAIIGSLQIAITMLKVPFTAAINQLDFSSAKNYMEMSQIILDNISIVSTTAIYTAFAGIVLDFIIRVLIATMGDRIYKNRVISKIKEINRENDDKSEAFRKKGGVSLFAGVLAYIAVSELPTIIAYTLGML